MQTSINQRAYFVIGTDTNVGKTYVTQLLLKKFNRQGLLTIGLKPVATGAIHTHTGLENDDALILQDTASIKLPLSQVNPFVFEEPIAPHLAAAMQNVTLSAEKITNSILNTMASYSADRYLIEGAGGLLVPLNSHETMLDVMKALNFPVILVVGIRLGCINHALLTAQAIRAPLHLAGWIANCIDSDCKQQENIIDTLQDRLHDIPCLAVIPFMHKTKSSN